MTRKKLTDCETSSTKALREAKCLIAKTEAKIARKLKWFDGQVRKRLEASKSKARAVAPSVPTFSYPHVAPAPSSPCLQKWAAEANAYLVLLTATNAWLQNQTATTLSAYRNAMLDFVGKWTTTEACYRGGWIV